MPAIFRTAPEARTGINWVKQRRIMMHKQVIEFWFDEIEPVMWFKKDDDFDRLLHSRFGEIWRAAAAGELAHWRR